MRAHWDYQRSELIAISTDITSMSHIGNVQTLTGATGLPSSVVDYCVGE